MTTTSELSHAWDSCPRGCDTSRHTPEDHCHFSRTAAFGRYGVEIARDPALDDPTVLFLDKPTGAERYSGWCLLEGIPLADAQAIIEALQRGVETARTEATR